MNYSTGVLHWSGFLAMLFLAPASAMAQEVKIPIQLSEFGPFAISEGLDQQILTSGIATVKPNFTELPASLDHALLDNEGLDGTQATSEVVAGVDGTADSAWVTESLEWLDQTVVTQASLPAIGAQASSPMPLPASTSSSDLQPVGSPAAGEDLFQILLGQSPTIAQATSTQAQSDQWHFLLKPYIYVPFFISGSANFKGTEDFQNSFSRDFENTEGSRDFEFTPSQVITTLENTLNFAFLGEIEAWTPNYTLGVLANVDYLSLTARDTFARSVRRPGFADFIPTELNSALNVQLWNADLAASYRFYDSANVNPEGVETEFDLGPFVFDVVGGVNLTVVNTQLGLNTNLGGNGESTTSDVIVSPLLGGRFRWNATPRLALLASGSVSGFGISGLMKYGFLGGIDWIFSGNTSLGLGYRVSILDYNSGSSEVDLDVDQHGPYLNFGFRF
jgi:hypothetical protein